jgi:hypothetical protein
MEFLQEFSDVLDSLIWYLAKPEPDHEVYTAEDRKEHLLQSG